jgi:hypothetical protein
MQHGKFIKNASRKKWFWPLIREMAFNPGRWNRDGGGSKMTGGAYHCPK